MKMKMRWSFVLKEAECQINGSTYFEGAFDFNCAPSWDVFALSSAKLLWTINDVFT